MLEAFPAIWPKLYIITPCQLNYFWLHSRNSCKLVNIPSHTQKTRRNKMIYKHSDLFLKMSEQKWNTKFPKESILWPLFFVLKVQELSSKINTLSKAAVTADDTSVLISSKISVLPFSDKHSTINTNKWFTTSNFHKVLFSAAHIKLSHWETL
jgi:hypothetical protein